MANDNIKEFTAQWVLFGLLFFCLLTFAVTFTANNNPTGLGDSGSVFDSFNSNLTSNLIATEENSNSLLNISAETNPEVSDLGSRDSVASSYGLVGNARNFFTISKGFLGWVITGIAGQILVAVLGGLFGFTALYFIIKAIRNGI